MYAGMCVCIYIYICICMYFFCVPFAFRFLADTRNLVSDIQVRCQYQARYIRWTLMEGSVVVLIRFVRLYFGVIPFWLGLIWTYLDIFWHIGTCLDIFGQVFGHIWTDFDICLQISGHILACILTYLDAFGHIGTGIWTYLGMFGHIWTYFGQVFRHLDVFKHIVAGI